MHRPCRLRVGQQRAGDERAIQHRVGGDVLVALVGAAQSAVPVTFISPCAPLTLASAKATPAWYFGQIERTQARSPEYSR